MSKTEKDSIVISEFKSIFQDTNLTLQIAKLFQQIFSEEPWDEKLKCPVCEKVFGASFTGTICTSCFPEKAVLLIEYWPISRVLKEIYSELSQPGAKCFLAFEEKNLVGFAWGYNLTISKELSKELHAPDLQKYFSGDYFYIAEVAILTTHRRKGIAEKMFQSLAQCGKSERIILRTMDKSGMFYLTQKCGGKTIYTIGDGKVIMNL